MPPRIRSSLSMGTQGLASNIRPSTSPIDTFFVPAGELRNHWPTEGLPGLACPDVRHRASCQLAALADLEDPRHRRAGSIPCGPLGNGRLVESPVLLDFLRRPCRALGRRHPTRLPRATGAAHPRTVVVQRVSCGPATRSHGGSGRRRNPVLAICRCA